MVYSNTPGTPWHGDTNPDNRRDMNTKTKKKKKK